MYKENYFKDQISKEMLKMLKETLNNNINDNNNVKNKIITNNKYGKNTHYNKINYFNKK